MIENLFNLVVFFAINILLIFNGLVLSRKFNLTLVHLERAIDIFLLYFFQLVVLLEIDGIFGILEYKTLIGEILVLSGLILIFRLKNKGELKNSKANYYQNLPFSFFLGIVSAIVSLILGLWKPPMEWDALMYHLVMPVEWLKRGKLDYIEVRFGPPAISYYPFNGELFFLWLIMPFRDDYLANVGQFPFFLLGTVSIYLMGKKLGATKRHSLLACSLWLLTPEILVQSRVAVNDVIFSSLFLCGFYLVLRLNEDFTPYNFIILFLSIGLAMGTKLIGWVYIPILTMFLFLLIIKNKSLSLDKKGIKVLLLGLLIFITASGYWYVRNLLTTGNPFYPLKFKVLGIEILKGAFTQKAIKNSPFYIDDPSFIPILLRNLFGWGFVFLIGFLAFIILFLIPKRTFNFLELCFFLMPFLLFINFWLFVPKTEQRHLFSLAGLSYLWLAIVCQKLNWIREPLEIAFTCGGMLNLLLSRKIDPQWMIKISIIIITLGAILWSVSNLIYRGKPIKKGNLKSKMILSGLVLFLIIYVSISTHGPRLNEDKIKDLWNIEAGWAWIYKYVSGKNIGYAGDNRTYFLYGKRYQNNVIYIDINGHQGWTFKNFYNHLKKSRNFVEPETEKPGYYRQFGDIHQWLKNLWDNNVSYLFIAKMHPFEQEYIWHDNQGFPIEDFWAGIRRDLFIPVFKNDAVHIYYCDFDKTTRKEQDE